QADRAFVAQLNAFVEALRDHHHALHAEAQLARSILLKLAGGERRRGAAAALLLFDVAHRPLRLLQRRGDLFGFFLVRALGLLVATPDKTRIERRRPARGKVGVDGPVFFLFKRLDLALAVDYQTQRDGLHASGGKAAPHLVPQEGRYLV